MFDVGFSELIVIGVVALVVIGPERLPKVARTAGVLVGRLQRYVAQVKADINREMEAADLGKVKQEFESAARSFQSEVESKAREVETEIRQAQSHIEGEIAAASAAVAEPAAPPAPAALPTPPHDAAPPASPQLELGIEDTTPAPPPRDKPSA
jgi:sec-independent protein translocase protein TatB